MKLITIAHAGTSGNRGTESIFEILITVFHWDNMRNDVEDFVSECILCILSKTGSEIPLPLSSTHHGEYLDQVLHFDYLYLSFSTQNDIYALVLKAEISGYFLLKPTGRDTSDHSEKVLERWICSFTAPEYWVSDQGSHFVNEIIKKLAETFRRNDRPNVAYCP